MASSLIWGRYVVVKAEDDRSTTIDNGAVYQEDGVIRDVGTYDVLKSKYTPDQALGGPQFAVIPGLVNAHSHGRGLTTFQLGSVDDALELKLIRDWARRTTDPYLATLFSSMQLISGGVTTVMYNHIQAPPDVMADEARTVLKAFGEAGLRVAFSIYFGNQNRLAYDDEQLLSTLPADLADQVRGRIQRLEMPDEDYLDLIAELHRSYDRGADGLVRVLVSPMNVQWCSEQLLTRSREYATHLGMLIHMHLVETVYQKLYGLRKFGVTPLRYLHDLGFLGPDVSLAHAVWVTEEDIRLLQETGTAVCHNPSSNLRFGSGIAPVLPMLNEGVRVALGTDGTSMNDEDDLFDEMRLALRLHRLPGIPARAPTVHQVLKMATVNGARVTGFTDVGSLETGQRADLVLIDLQRPSVPYLSPNVGIVELILARVRRSDVHTVVIDGEMVYREGRFPRLDQDAIVRELQKNAARDQEAVLVEGGRMAQRLLPYVHDFYQDWDLSGADPYYAANSRT